MFKWRKKKKAATALDELVPIDFLKSPDYVAGNAGFSLDSKGNFAINDTNTSIKNLNASVSKATVAMNGFHTSANEILSKTFTDLASMTIGDCPKCGVAIPRIAHGTKPAHSCESLTKWGVVVVPSINAYTDWSRQAELQRKGWRVAEPKAFIIGSLTVDASKISTGVISSTSIANGMTGKAGVISTTPTILPNAGTFTISSV